MKTSVFNRTFLSFFLLILTLVLINCSREDKIAKEPDYVGKVILVSCGGTVIQLLNSDTLGETWTNHFISPNLEYKNCVLVGNLNPSIAKSDTIFGLNFKFVDSFSSGIFCDIGGLPKTKIEIQELFEFTKL